MARHEATSGACAAGTITSRIASLCSAYSLTYTSIINNIINRNGYLYNINSNATKLSQENSLRTYLSKVKIQMNRNQEKKTIAQMTTSWA